MAEYITTIGLEIHAQIRTASKMFDNCSADYAKSNPNTRVSVVSMGFPGSLPVTNRRAVELAAVTGLALNCGVNHHSVFARKSYPYPDLPKGYQITQYEEPLCSDGWIEIMDDNDNPKRIGIERLHIEEDTGRLLHAGDNSSLIDYNRSGVPLMEIVTRPDITSPEEAKRCFQKIRQILTWIDVNSGNMDEGALRCDANVSVRLRDQANFGAKVEIKNINSFRFVERALTYEIQRQIGALEAGDTIIQETRGWNETLNKTVSQRTKEFADDYRYFPEPDIPPLLFDDAWVEARRAELPELPDAHRARFESAYELSCQDADLLTGERAVADYYETAVEAVRAVGASAKEAANWILGELFRLINDDGVSSDQMAVRMPPQHIATVIDLVAKGTITRTVAKQVFEESYRNGIDPARIVADKGLTQISDTDALATLAREILASDNAAKAVAEYRKGKTSAIQFLIGQMMKAIGYDITRMDMVDKRYD
ncbi:MAG: Asp-tRNA(Asn)/Glu-tRNA(Gln) amidotransferase subunit GatB [Chloroflexales bacterium]|nr:Asp-tRNA(Asn)/Glu-tRNA(Gln) amidotransferase subunit GatB [Chloroflexales bacterium]